MVNPVSVKAELKKKYKSPRIIVDPAVGEDALEIAEPKPRVTLVAEEYGVASRVEDVGGLVPYVKEEVESLELGPEPEAEDDLLVEDEGEVDGALELGPQVEDEEYEVTVEYEEDTEDEVDVESDEVLEPELEVEDEENEEVVEDEIEVEVDEALELELEVEDEENEEVVEDEIEVEVDEALELELEVEDEEDEVVVVDDERVEELELDEVEDEEDDELVEDAPQAPVIDGTASTPLPIATRFVPQSAALARRRFWLS
ncbi:MAG: hypothetical protein M1813_001590 [Trichoglossum hirsutum]|nr:MAG: hypothetical protein M1813_001590 [Trichoglossum hirsutum]